jgi:hypothetical protein
MAIMREKGTVISTGQRTTLDIMSFLTEGVNNAIKVTSWVEGGAGTRALEAVETWRITKPYCTEFG